ncbi:hypothetical protein [Aequorivita sublithincola]|uniref:hypothetical protein n=1 Tax=Aequorivita sublithincola TaxID=101385 RepID=UPI0005A7FB44|nr:hypothetical protein [Aequorivita sublithincola]
MLLISCSETSKKRNKLEYSDNGTKENPSRKEIGMFSEAVFSDNNKDKDLDLLEPMRGWLPPFSQIIMESLLKTKPKLGSKIPKASGLS